MSFKNRLIKLVIKVVIILLCMILLTYMYSTILDYNSNKKINEEKLENAFFNVKEEVCAYVTLYTIYGNHLNLSGYINLNDCLNMELYDVKLILKDEIDGQKQYKLDYIKDSEKISFKLSDKINEGIDLDQVNEGKYYLFVKLTGSLNDNVVEETFSIENISEYGKNEYYTLTKNGINKKIDVEFSEYLKCDKEIKYMGVVSKRVKLPADVYDIVIDPGHGGRDVGATYDGKNESDFTLQYSLMLKEELEKLGYKVKLTRTEDKYTESYGKGSRAVLPYETKSKLVLSIHINSTASNDPEGGVEVYAPNNANLSFAKSIADNIVEYTGTKYSVNNYAKALDGVYVRTYTSEEIEEAIEYAHDLEYAPYETLSTSTPYLFMIRETGGIMTKAYNDGRNKYIKNNPYYNSNISAEGYLVELGFINSKSDIENLINNKKAYIRAIAKSIVSNYK